MSKKPQAPLVIPEDIITHEEYEIRKKVWGEYYKKVEKTRAYEIYKEVREEITKMTTSHIEKKTPKLKELLAENKKIMMEEKYLPKPNFLDPDIEMSAGNCGVDTYWQDLVKQARLYGREIIYQNDKARELLEPAEAPSF